MKLRISLPPLCMQLGQTYILIPLLIKYFFSRRREWFHTDYVLWGEKAPWRRSACVLTFYSREESSSSAESAQKCSRDDKFESRVRRTDGATSKTEKYRPPINIFSRLRWTCLDSILEQYAPSQTTGVAKKQKIQVFRSDKYNVQRYIQSLKAERKRCFDSELQPIIIKR